MREVFIKNKEETRWVFVKDIDRRSPNNKRIALYKCVCGNIKEVIKSNVKSGGSKSCGCIKRSTFVSDHRKEHNAWRDMRYRCNNTNSPVYPLYGGRGIFICDRWQESFSNFLEDMGQGDKKSTLERIDNNKGYNKENCIWATWKEQGNNRRSNRVLTINNEKKTISEWAELVGLPKTTISGRLRKGFSERDAVFLTLKETKEMKDKKSATRFLIHKGEKLSLREWSKKFGLSLSSVRNTWARNNRKNKKDN